MFYCFYLEFVHLTHLSKTTKHFKTKHMNTRSEYNKADYMVSFMFLSCLHHFSRLKPDDQSINICSVFYM